MAARRDGHQQPLRVGGISNDRMEAKPTASRLPLLPMFVFQKAIRDVPGIAAILRFKQGGRLDPCVEQIGR